MNKKRKCPVCGKEVVVPTNWTWRSFGDDVLICYDCHLPLFIITNKALPPIRNERRKNEFIITPRGVVI